MGLQDAFKNFISYIKHEENLSTNTVKAYEADISTFLEYLRQQQGIDTAKDITHLHIRTFLSHLYTKLDKPSIARKTSSIRAFFRYLNMQGFIGAEILSRILRPKIPSKLMFALSVEDMKAMLSSIDISTVLGRRNLAIIELLYGAGLRVTELASIKLQDVDFKERIIKILGKGRKERVVPFNEEAVGTLKSYLDIRSELLKADKPSDYIFLNKSGTPLGVRSIQRLTKLISVKAGLLKSATPHTMRHTYATHLLEAGASIKTVKELLGHSSIAATQRYTHLTMDKLTQVYKKSHPKA